MYRIVKLGVLLVLVFTVVLGLLAANHWTSLAAHVRCNSGPDDRRTQSMIDAVRLTAVGNVSPPSITLRWEPHNSSAEFEYSIYRKQRDDKNWGIPIAKTNDLQYTDSSVTVGDSYEYRVARNGRRCTHQFGYIYTGIARDAVDQRGKLILLVDDRFTTALAENLAWLELDLIADGWQVLRHDVSMDASVNSVKQLIMADYEADPDKVKAVYLFGHIPVPYSGMHSLDGHELRAFPADIYYGDVDGDWTDESINQPETTNPNVPGDGHFDQTFVTASSTDEADHAPELFVGRVDFWDMPAFPQGEEALLANYIEKAHDYRNKETKVRQRGWISDRMNQILHWEIATIGMWHSMVPLVGTDTYADDTMLPEKMSGIYRSQYSPDPDVRLNEDDVVYGDNGSSPSPNYDSHGFIFADVSSTARYTIMDSSGTTNDFRNQDPPVIFNIMFGSYFGDWDTQNNLLRAPLAQETYGLSNVWGVWGGWQFHHMAMGEPIGYSVVASQHAGAKGEGRSRAQYLYDNSYNSAAPEMNLMGDPTLRMHIVAPPSDMVLNGTQLSWRASAEPTLVGYHLYRASTYNGAYTRLTDSPISGTTYDDSGASGNDVYMVRAVKLETSPSGSYFNLSQGAFAGDGLPTEPAEIEPYSLAKEVPGRVDAEMYTRSGGEIWSEETHDAEGSHNLAGLDNGDWAEYLIDVVEAGVYQVDLRISTPGDGGMLRVFVDGAEVALLAMPNTGGWQAWQTISAEIPLTTGNDQTIRLEYIQTPGEPGLNINWLDFALKQ